SVGNPTGYISLFSCKYVIILYAASISGEGILFTSLYPTFTVIMYAPLPYLTTVPLGVSTSQKFTPTPFLSTTDTTSTGYPDTKVDPHPSVRNVSGLTYIL